MTSKIIVFFIACFIPCIYSEQNVEDIIDEIFYVPAYDEQDKAFERLDFMLTKHVASTSRYNFIWSPLGLKMALCSLAEGAIGITRSELLSVLGFPLDNITMTKYTTITSSLRKYYPLYVSLGSQIFVSDDLELSQRLVVTADNAYNTQLKTVNIRDPFEAVNKIKSWVSNITQAKVFDSFNEYDVTNMAMLVLNTLYFKNNFKYNFEPNATKVEQFYISPSVLKDVPFMHVVDFFSYRESEKFDAKILGMTYAQPFVIYFIVPNTLLGLPRVVDNLSNLGIELNKLRKRFVDVTLPKFKLDYTSRLTGILKRLGVEEAFQDNALFEQIGRNKRPHKWLKISNIMQRYDFEVNEYGSGVDGPLDVLEIRDPVKTTLEVVGNRPFLFILQDTSTKVILLIGRISDPSVPQGYFEVV